MADWGWVALPFAHHKPVCVCAVAWLAKMSVLAVHIRVVDWWDWAAVLAAHHVVWQKEPAAAGGDNP